MGERTLVWRRMVAARIRSQWQYRSSFVADVMGQLVLTLTEFVEVYVLLHVAPVFGGVTLVQAALIYGLAQLSFGLADMVFGELDTVNDRIKAGTLEVLLTRPASLLGQLICSDIQLRRLGRACFGLVTYLVTLTVAGVEPTGANIALSVLAPVGGFIIFGALFTFASGVLFFVIDGNQAVNASTYGGKYVAGLPGAALHTPVRQVFTFVIPATFIAYVPATILTGAPLPALWWPPMAWLTVPLGLFMWAVILLFWRRAVAHYTGAGG